MQLKGTFYYYFQQYCAKDTGIQKLREKKEKQRKENNPC